MVRWCRTAVDCPPFLQYLGCHLDKAKVKVKLHSLVRLFATPWTVAPQAPPSMGFSRQEYWSGVPLPTPGDLPDPGIEPRSPTLQAYALTSEPKLKAALRLGSWPIWLSHASISTALAPEWVAWVPLRDPQENTQGKDHAWS